jgi:hypothetical protein
MGKQPEHVDGDFYCSDNKLTSLEGAPSSVGGYFVCSRNKLTSLKGGPTSVGGYFNCYNNKLTSLKGGPTSIGNSFYAYNNNLTSLHNIHKQIKHIGGFANFRSNPITSCVLGLLLINGLKYVHLDKTAVQNIINKHLKGDRDIFACQEELIEDGFEDFAQL